MLIYRYFISKSNKRKCTLNYYQSYIVALVTPMVQIWISRLTFLESILKFDIFCENKFAYHIHRRIKPRFGAGVRDLSK